MVVGIHKDRLGKFPDSLLIYEKILKYNNIDCIRLDINELDFWGKIKELDLFIFRWNVATDLKELAKTIIPIIQNYLNVACFPDMATSWHYDDKIKEYYLLKQHGFPIAESYIFWDKHKALEWAKNATFPMVFKLRGGAGSQNVLLVKSYYRMFGKGINPNKLSFNTRVQLKDITLKRFIHKSMLRGYRIYTGEDLHAEWEKHKNYVLFQKFMPGNEFDTRVYVIGNRAFASRRFNRKNDFRASGSGRSDFDPEKIDKCFLETAFTISQTLKFQAMAYDFIYDEKGDPVITEISYIMPEWPIPKSPGYWDDTGKWFKGHFWPQYFVLMDALEFPDFRHPDFITL